MNRDIEFHRNRAKSFVSGLTTDEKLCSLFGAPADKGKLGLYFIDFCGEAAHGVQARHDQSFDLGEPCNTTVFPNPIGMAATFDKKLMHNIGEVVGTESRSLLNEKKHMGIVGLAPTVDMERDPRWGRNEEAYGEDPHLASRLAGEYILGMAGDDDYIRSGATLKHFYANNYEKERYTADSKMPEDLKEDYYLRVFKETIDYSHPVSVMSSYNKVNGVTATFNPELTDLIKKWGVPFIVSDAFTLFFSVEQQKTAESGAEAVRKALDAGVDMFMEDPKFLYESMMEAHETGLITEKDIDTMLINKLTVYSLLGLMPEDLIFDNEKELKYSKYFPISEYNISKVDTEQSRSLARKSAAESTVLLKNDGVLPITKESFNDNDNSIVAVGPFVDLAPLDWYSGVTSHNVTVKEGLSNTFGSNRVSFGDLVPIVTVKPVDYTDYDIFGPDHKYKMMLWDESRVTLQDVETGKFLTSISPDTEIVNVEEIGGGFQLFCTADRPFSWFANESFQFLDKHGKVITFDADNAYNFWEDPRIHAMKNVDGSVILTFETVSSVDQQLNELAQSGFLTEESDVIACFGLHPIVNAKEERDRESIELPPFQRAVLRKIRESYKKITLMLMANAPIAVEEENNAPEIRSILWSSLGCEEMGNGIADIISGKVSPSGRLPQTWYRDDSQLPDINDYDIRRNGMTYIYMTDKPLYRFGFGLTYSQFEAQLISVDSNSEAEFEVSIKNTGNVTSDYVVQIYKSREGKYYLYGEDNEGNDVNGEKIPVGSILVAFDRINDMNPGEERIVKL